MRKAGHFSWIFFPFSSWSERRKWSVQKQFFYYWKCWNGKRYIFANVKMFLPVDLKNFLPLDRAKWIKSAFQTCNLWISSKVVVWNWFCLNLRPKITQFENESITYSKSFLNSVNFPISTFRKIEKIASEVCKRQASILRNTTRMWNKAAYCWKIVVNIIQIITV